MNKLFNDYSNNKLVINNDFSLLLLIEKSN